MIIALSLNYLISLLYKPWLYAGLAMDGLSLSVEYSAEWTGVYLLFPSLGLPALLVRLAELALWHFWKNF